MHKKSDPVVSAIETAIAAAYYEGQSLAIYLVNLALMAAKEELARRAASSTNTQKRS